MSNDQETAESQVEVEAGVDNEAVNEAALHTEVGEHEYTVEELKTELEEAQAKSQ